MATKAKAQPESPSIDRFTDPLYTLAEAARYLDVPASTLATWVRGYTRSPASRPTFTGSAILTAVRPARVGEPAVPFIGLAEGVVLSAIRKAGVPLQRIRPALALLQKEFDLPYLLASKRLHADGAEVLFDYAQQESDEEAANAVRQLVVVRSGQQVFREIIERYLQRVEFGADGYAEQVHLPAYGTADIVVDPARGFGQPVFARAGARLEDALSLFRSGEPIDVVAAEYGMPAPEFEDAVRLATRVAA